MFLRNAPYDGFPLRGFLWGSAFGLSLEVFLWDHPLGYEFCFGYVSLILFKQTLTKIASHISSPCFDKEAGHLDQVLWLLVTFVFLGLAVSLTWNTWTQWRDEQGVTFEFL